MRRACGSRAVAAQRPKLSASNRRGGRGALARPAASAAAGPGRLEAREGALPDQVLLELGKCVNHVEHQAPRRRLRSDLRGQRCKANTRDLQLLGQ